jgi:hypothetical protein
MENPAARPKGIVRLKKRGMVRGKYRRIPSEDCGNRRVFPEFMIQEQPDTPSVPPAGMNKVGIKGKVSIIELFRSHARI